MTPYGPSLRIVFPYDRANWPSQIGRVCKVIETGFPGNPIDGAIVFKGSRGEHRHVADRPAFLKERTKTKRCQFTLNNHFSCVAASGVIGPRYWGQMGLGGTVDFDGSYALMVFLPPGQSDADYVRAERLVRAALGLDPDVSSTASA